MKVVSPARVSRLSVVFHCLNLKNRSSRVAGAGFYGLH